MRAIMAPAVAVFLFVPAVACIVLVAGVTSPSPSPPPHHLIDVGGEDRLWSPPKGNDETYNHWAARNRFHVGDELRFKCAENDSVLVVSRADYQLCKVDKPEQRIVGGGEATVRLDRSGYFYFISGAPGHCDAGQRMTLNVMSRHGHGATASTPAKAPSPSGDDDEDDSGGSFRPTPETGGDEGYGSGSPRHAKTSGGATTPPPPSRAAIVVVAALAGAAALLAVA